jgi:hypothetical protein
MRSAQRVPGSGPPAGRAGNGRDPRPPDPAPGTARDTGAATAPAGRDADDHLPGQAGTAAAGGAGTAMAATGTGRSRRGRAWRLAGLAVAGWVLLFGGILIGTATSGERATPAQPAPPAERPAADGARCAQAIARADESLAMAVRVERALADRVRLRELEAGGRLTTDRTRQLDAVAEQRSAMASSRFDALLASYLEAAQGCRAQAR